MSFDADLVILGGGCAGLSLGVRLAAHAEAKRLRTVILERREQYANDRTWCFWRNHGHPFEALISKSWAKMRVRTLTGEVVLDCGRTPYQMLASDDFYRSAVERIGDTSAVELALGVGIAGQPTPIPGGWSVETSIGALRTRRIIDTRPPPHPRTDDALLWQSFLGEEVVCDAPIFDPSLVELMDFAEPRDDGIGFTYILPISRTRALVEYTVFGPAPLSAPQLAAAQRSVIAQITRGAATSTVRREFGVLPMGLTASLPMPGVNYSYAGLLSGAARPSTGYAFQRLQRWAKVAAVAVHSGGGEAGHAPDVFHQRMMDRLFLHVLRDHPARGPDLFLAMFGRVEAARIIRFLSDQATVLDYASVIAALPVGLFLTQLLKLSIPRAMTLGWNP